LGNLTNETLEGELADEQLRGFLVTTNFTEGDGTGPEAMGLLDTSSHGDGSLASSLGSKLLTGGLATSGLAGGLLQVVIFWKFSYGGRWSEARPGSKGEIARMATTTTTTTTSAWASRRVQYVVKWIFVVSVKSKKRVKNSQYWR
jgi:hypothetical protein